MTTLLAFSCSLRTGAFNTRVINSLAQLAPEGVTIVGFDIADLPMFNQDLDGDTVPEIVGALRAAVAEADGVIIASPEYNHSYSAAAKNLIDWASRPFMKGPIIGKRSMVISVGPGPSGGENCLAALTEILTLLGGTVVGSVGAGAIHEKLATDSDTITDVALAAQLSTAIAAF